MYDPLIYNVLRLKRSAWRSVGFPAVIVGGCNGAEPSDREC